MTEYQHNTQQDKNLNNAEGERAESRVAVSEYDMSGHDPKETLRKKLPSNDNKNGSNNNKNKKKPTDNDRTRTTIITIVICCLVAFFVGSQVFSLNTDNSPDTLETGEFIQAVEQGRIVSVTYAASDYTVSGEYYPASTAGGSITSAFNKSFDAMNALMAQSNAIVGEKLGGIGTSVVETQTLGSLKKYTSVYVGADSLGQLLADHPEIQYEITLPNGWSSILVSLLPFVLIAILLVFFFNQMQKANNSQLSFGKNKAKKTTEERPDVKFSDVAGVDEAVEEMQEVKDFLANPEKYQSIGAKIPRGCLLVGPPGTGKTLLARAVAGEAGVPFFSISGSDFVEMFVGVGASRVRDLFKDAKESAPSIIFIDEIDAVGRQRGTGLGGGHDEREQTLNQLLVEMDGFDATESVVLIAATNRADVLDPALLRPGRFDRQIVVDTPDVRGRQRILEVHSKDKPIGSDVNLEAIAKITPGFTGADLANLMNESALLTARKNKKIITMREVNESLERVIAGPERKGRVMNEHTKHIIAYHESGHALVGHLLEHADPVHKISIISRGRALGYTLSIPDEDKVLNSLSEMKDELAVFMGGRVAEEIFCDDITTGASNDLERASKMARAMVTQYGMSPLGTQVFGQPNHEVFLGRDYGNTQDYSEETARKIDDEVAKIMREAHDRAEQILKAHSDQMDLMASVLLDRETIEGEACQALLDNKWDDYLAHEGEIIAKHEAEEAAARAKDEAEGPANMHHDSDTGVGSNGSQTLADANWRENRVEPGDQNANGPYSATPNETQQGDEQK
jgi:cell division protease FtsH